MNKIQMHFAKMEIIRLQVHQEKLNFCRHSYPLLLYVSFSLAPLQIRPLCSYCFSYGLLLFENGHKYLYWQNFERQCIRLGGERYSMLHITLRKVAFLDSISCRLYFIDSLYSCAFTSPPYVIDSFRYSDLGFSHPFTECLSSQCFILLSMSLDS